MWASPGLYLRDSTLRVAARTISNLDLPSSFYEGMTFGEVPETQTRPPPEDDHIGRSLRFQIKRGKEAVQEDEGEETREYENDD